MKQLNNLVPKRFATFMVAWVFFVAVVFLVVVCVFDYAASKPKDPFATIWDDLPSGTRYTAQ